MRKLLIGALAVGSFAAFPVFAQDATPEASPEMEMSSEMDMEVATAHIRVGHFSADAPTVTTFINGEPSGIQDLSFPDLSGWVEVPVGTYSIAVAPAGGTVDDAVIGPVDLTFEEDTWTTISAIGSVGAGTLSAALISEDVSALDAETARVTIFHGIEGAPAVDLIVNGEVSELTGLAFGEFVTVDLPAASYDFQVVATGTTDTVVLDLPGTELSGNTFFFVAAVGTPDAPQAFVEAVGGDVLEPFFAPSGTVVDVLVEAGTFNTLLAAVEAAGLGETLATADEITIFAPTDDAFALIDADTLNGLLEDTDALTNILLYHVASGRLLAEDVVAATSVTTLQGSDVEISVNEDGVFLNGTTQVIVVDLGGSNGVVHAIDAVLLPPSE
jgi:hypothetical protein